MTIEVKSGSEVLAAVQSAVAKHGATKEELIPIMLDVNREVGYLPSTALEEIANQLHMPKSQLFSVASFYRMLSTKPRGRHIIQFCESAPCHVVGGRQVWQRLQDELMIKNGETTEDGKWTLLTTSCLGICAVGPVVVIDDDIYGNVKPDQLPDILARYQ